MGKTEEKGEETVKVAVRVRPFNKRERERKAKLIVEMVGSETRLTDPDDPANPKVSSCR